MGMAADLQPKPRGKSGLGLTQIHPGRLRQRHQLITPPLVRLGVRRIGDVLFHHGRVDHHTFDPVFIAHDGFLRGPDCQGQQPFDTFLNGPPPPAR